MLGRWRHSVRKEHLNAVLVFGAYGRRGGWQKARSMGTHSEDNTGKPPRAAATNQETERRDEKPIEFVQRLKICSKCEHGKQVVQGYVTFCQKCGCHIQSKAMFEALHCPIGKW